MSNITITDKGNYYESSCGAWSRDGINWYSEDCKCMYGEPHRLAFKQQILDGQAAEVEPEVFTGDPSEWDDGLYFSDESRLWVVVKNHEWAGIKEGGSVWGSERRPLERLIENYTRISTNPADIISDKVKGVTV